jgi:hypothetical protein
MLPLSRPHAEERAQRASRSMRHGRWPPHPSRRRLLRPSDEAVLVLRAFAQSHAVFFVPAARCCVRVYPSLRMYLRFPVRRQAHEGFGASGRRDSSNPSPRPRGRWSADRRTLGLLSRVRGATPALVRRGPSRCDRDPFRRSTVALSSCGPTRPSRQWNTGGGSDCPRQAVNAWRSGSGPPAVRFAPQPRDATPCSVLQDRF